MPTPRCPSTEEIRAYLQGDLPAARLEEVGDHVAGCSACDATAAELDTEIDGVVAALRSTKGASASVRDPGRPPEMVGDYQILEEIGRGGMGVVYKARHVGLNRLAAVKMILAGRYAGAEDQMRFRIEGELLARLRHAHIVEVFESGLQDGRPYLALEWVDGGTLEQLLAGPPLPPRRAAAILEELADAVSHAHRNGVIHRDLKPANVLLTKEGAPKVTDFGLARANAADVSGITVTGTVMGTPAYMAPEQARGDSKAVGASSDVYALGAIGFALLTGRPPFVAASMTDLMEAVFESPAPSVSRFRPGVPRDLDTILQRCLEKDPARRYAVASDLADDLQRWRTGRPIQARPVPGWERLYRFARRNPVPTTAAAVICIVVVAAFVRIEISRESEANARVAAERGEDAAKAATQAESAARKLAERREAITAADRAVLRCEAGELSVGIAEFARARAVAEAAEDSDLTRALRINHSVWASRQPQLIRQFDSPTAGESVRTAIFLDAGRTLVTAGKDLGVVRIWPVSGGPARELPAPPIRFRSPFTETVLTDTAEKTLYVAHGDNTIRPWDLATLKPIEPILSFGLRRSIQCAAISPEGRLLAAGEEDGTVRVWNTATGATLGNDLIHTPDEPNRRATIAVTSVAFASEGMLLTAGRRNGVIIWDLATGSPKDRIDIGGDVFRIAVSPDSKTVLVAGEAAATLWPIDRPTKPLMTWNHPERVEGLAFSPDGRLIATGDHAANVWVWERDNGSLFARFRHADQVRVLRFSPDSRSIVVGGIDGSSSLWTLPERTVVAQGAQPSFHVAHSAGFGFEDRMIWTVSANGLRTWQTPTPEMVAVHRPLKSDTKAVWSGTMNSDGTLAVTGAYDTGSIQVWNARTGERVGGLLKHKMTVRETGFLPDHRTFFTRQTDRSDAFVRWWRVQEQTVAELPAWPVVQDIRAITAHPDGRRVLVAHHAAARVTVRDIATAAETGPSLVHPGPVTAVAVHPSGLQAATGGADGGVRIWDVATAELRGRVGFHGDRVNKVAWGPNDTLATASDDGTARIWDSRTLLPLGPPLRHPAAVLAVAFNSKGTHSVTAARDGGITVWKWSP